MGVIPGTKGVQIQCDSPSGKAQLLGWTGSIAPKRNQTEDKVVMRDGARLTTQTVFPPFLAFPPTGRDKCADVFVQTPYDINGDLSGGVKSIPSLIDSVVYGATKLHFQAVITLQQSRGLYSSGPPTEPDPPNSFDNGNHTKDDSGDTGKWIRASNWSNGVIMTQGASAMGMMASLAAGAKPHVVTRASWLFITTNNIREVFFRQGALINGRYNPLYRINYFRCLIKTYTGIMGAILAPGYVPPEQCARAPIAAHEGDGPDPFWEPMKFDDWSSVSWPTVIRTSWFDMFQVGGLRIGNNYYEEARCARVFGCTSTLLVDALGHAGLHGALALLEVAEASHCMCCIQESPIAQDVSSTMKLHRDLSPATKQRSPRCCCFRIKELPAMLLLLESMWSMQA